MWLLFAILTVLFWGTSDVVFKSAVNKGTAGEGKLLALNGIVYGLVCLAYWAITGVQIHWTALLRYLPIASCYIVSMVFYYKMMPHIKISLASPIANSSCLLTTLLCVFLLKQTVNTLQAIAIALIITALFILYTDKSEQTEGVGLREYLFGVGCAMVYFTLDGVGSFLDDAILGENAGDFAENLFGETLGENEVIIIYGLFYLTAGLLSLLRWKGGKIRGEGMQRPLLDKKTLLGCLLETAGQFTYVFTYASGDAAVASPFIASFTAISVLLSRVFLREKLRAKQYVTVSMMLFGMFLLSIE